MNTTRLIPLLDADGDIGAASAEFTEPSSVVTGEQTPDVETASASAPEVEGTPDVTQQESFAARLREATSKLEDQYKPHRERAERAEQIAKAAGFVSVEDYLDAADRQLKEQQAAVEAERLGLDHETYNQFFAPVHDELKQTKQQLEQLRQADLERQVRSEYEGLKARYPDFSEIEEQVFTLAADRRLPLEDAYKIASYDARIDRVQKETEQRVLANITGRDEKQVLPGNDKGGSTLVDPGTMSLADIQSISQRVQRGERITL